MNSSPPQTVSEPIYLPPPPAPAVAPQGPTQLARTDSATSFSSEEDASMSPSPVAVMNSARRTRKRFTNTQLTMLENLFHLNSHPSREDREAVARDGGMETKSVTIWFQNKRQTERKTAASNNNNNNNNGANGGSSHGATSHAVPNITSTIHTFSLHGEGAHGQGPSSRTASPPFSISSRSSITSASICTATTTAYSSSRPSLDRVASRSELRAAAPRTPSRRPAHPGTGAIWDNMPSSPLAPPISPPAREFIDFGKNARTRRTLEWACAAARLVDKDGYASGMSAGFGAGGGSGGMYASSSAPAAPVRPRARTVSREKMRVRAGPSQHHQSHYSYSRDPNGAASDSISSSRSRERDTYAPAHTHSYVRSRDTDMDLTDEEDHEAITPPSTWGKDDRRWTPAGAGEGRPTSLLAMTEAAKGGMSPRDIRARVDDDDMFRAALALCGLGRRT
ncbi:Homeobox protein ANF-1 [Psilocybe cubensis]|uniref:Homeobox protein ANF-1 n=2 Tax=Psilocybe cubensis TaxID=181762 RepID=A0ACB8HDL8_PSICU|nr:Homeobox protein ANF-1 [Psilocybe cubensis]KAH9486115.1 Homeobox protein ANF-1 [Psilocybe cubensis]